MAHEVPSDPGQHSGHSTVRARRREDQAKVLETVRRGGDVNHEPNERDELVDEDEAESCVGVVREDRAGDHPGAGDDVHGDREELDLRGRERVERLDDGREGEPDRVDGCDDGEEERRAEPDLPVGDCGQDECSGDLLSLADRAGVVVLAPPTTASVWLTTRADVLDPLLLLWRKVIARVGGVDNHIVGEHTDEHRRSALEDEDVTPGGVPAESLHLADRESQKSAERSRHRRSCKEDGRAVLT